MKKKILATLFVAVLLTSLYTLSVSAAGNVAKIGTTEYATLAEAIDAAKTSETITLIGDATITQDEFSKINEKVTIDGAFRTITVGAPYIEGERNKGLAITTQVSLKNIVFKAGTGCSYDYFITVAGDGATKPTNSEIANVKIAGPIQTGAAKFGVAFQLYAVDGITIKNLTIDSSCVTKNETWSNFQIVGAENTTIDGLKIESVSPAIKFDATSDLSKGLKSTIEFKNVNINNSLLPVVRGNLDIINKNSHVLVPGFSVGVDFIADGTFKPNAYFQDAKTAFDKLETLPSPSALKTMIISVADVKSDGSAPDFFYATKYQGDYTKVLNSNTTDGKSDITDALVKVFDRSGAGTIGDISFANSNKFKLQAIKYSDIPAAQGQIQFVGTKIENTATDAKTIELKNFDFSKIWTKSEALGVLSTKFETDEGQTKELNTFKDLVVVVFDPMGGEIGQTLFTVQRNTAVGTIPATTSVGRVFLGWYTGAYGEGTKANPTTIITGDVTFYANWKAIDTTYTTSTTVKTSQGGFYTDNTSSTTQNTNYSNNTTSYSRTSSSVNTAPNTQANNTANNAQTNVKENPSERTEAPLKIGTKSVYNVKTKVVTPVYEKTSKKSSKIFSVHASAPMIVVGGKISSNGETWRRIMMEDGAFGYVQEKNLTKTSDTALLSTVKANAKIGIVSKNIKIYDKTSNDKAKVGTVTSKSAVCIIGESGNYYIIAFGKTRAYVAKNAVKVASSSDYTL